MLYSTSYPYALRSAQFNHDPYYFLYRQLGWIGIGIVAMLVLAKFDYNNWRGLVLVLFLFAVVLLVLVLIPGVGRLVKGSRRWLWFGQPSELAKIATILFLAHFLDRWQGDVQKIRLTKLLLFRQKKVEWWRGILAPFLGMGAVVLLILLETDAGTAALIGLVCFFVMLLGGVRWWLLVPSYGAGGAALVWYLIHDPVRGKRITDFYDFWNHIRDTCFQQYQAMLAFATGNLTGLGLGQSRTKENYLPEAPNDFIAPIIGEELGLVGMALLLIAFVVFLFAGIYISSRARDLYGFLLGMGIVTLVGFQALINLAVVTSLIPNKGLPLPLISYGGSNLCVILASVGLLLSIARHAGPAEEVPAHAGARRLGAYA